ncbi:MAG: hypothetical protein ACFHHU_03365 [Porticoccaceae bacterium]
MKPNTPAVTCSAQATYLTGKPPSGAWHRSQWLVFPGPE